MDQDIQPEFDPLRNHQQTNSQFITGWIPFLSPNQQCHSTEGKISHSTNLIMLSSIGGLQPCIVFKISPLPWRDAIASHQPSEMPVPIMIT